MKKADLVQLAETFNSATANVPVDMTKYIFENLEIEDVSEILTYVDLFFSDYRSGILKTNEETYAVFSRNDVLNGFINLVIMALEDFCITRKN